MTTVHTTPIIPTEEPIDRPVHREQCPEGHSYVGGLEANSIRDDWQKAHAKHWEGRESDE
jgi:hypothetical protein